MTCYSISQPYNAYFHNKGEPYFLDLKSVLVPDKSDNKPHLDKDCITVQKLCLTGDHHIPNIPNFHTFFKHHHSPFHGDHHPYLKHYHNPCYNSHHDAAWYHAHDSGNTVVLNIPPYWGWGWGTGTKWAGATEVARAEGMPIGHSEPIAAADPVTEII
ncbi:hypothetical protein [Candidatus Wolbachia massiliensis]|uniref:Uncharacterized protein n=1 Tax=Candidatus Wolbachia massiliensis TaxID=1845000 RepID=A0A7L7YQL0_9RICK|nr:hypothetical protein [Candidatus Wolbachia massiliensis]QOD38375.1 hypothetical protein ID128_00380 [Candidatus Wolbachia massiliensis]